MKIIKYISAVTLLLCFISSNAQNWTNISRPNGGNISKFVEVYNSSQDELYIYGANESRVHRKNVSSGQWSNVSSLSFGAPIVLYDEINEVLYAINFGAVAVSNDYGFSWNEKYSYDDGVNFFDNNEPANELGVIILEEVVYHVDIDGNTTLYAGSNNNGVFKSTDQGSNWYQINDNLNEGAFDLAVQYNSSGEELLYVAYSSGLYKYDISGNEFLVSDLSTINIETIDYSTEFGKIEVSIDDVFLINDEGLFTYTDDGFDPPSASVVTSLPTLSQNKIIDYDEFSGLVLLGEINGGISAYDPFTTNITSIKEQSSELNEIFSIYTTVDAIYISTAGGNGVYRSDDGNSWVIDNNGLVAYGTEFTSYATIPSSDQILYATDQGGLYKYDQIDGWLPIKSRSNENVNSLSLGYDTTNNRILFGSQYSDNLGGSWANITGGPQNRRFIGFSENAVYSYDYIGSNEQVVKKSTNGGITFNNLAPSYLHNDSDGLSFIYTSSGNILIARPNYQNNSSSPIIIRSGDDFLTPAVDISPSGLDNPIFTKTHLTEGDDGTVYFAGYSELLKTTNDGDSWENLPLPPSGYIGSLKFYNGVLFAGSSSGLIYYTLDEGNTWQSTRPNLNNFNGIVGLYISENYLWAEFYGGELSTLPLSEVVPAEAVTNLDVKQIGEGVVLLTWSVPPGSANDGYRILKSNDGGNNYSEIDDRADPDLNNIQFGVTIGEENIFRIEAYNSFSSNSTDSQPFTVETVESPAFEISPPNFTSSDQITITYYSNRSYPVGALTGTDSVYFYSGIVTEETFPNGWVNVTGNFGVGDGIGAMSKVGEDTFQITLTPRDYYNITPDQFVRRLGFIFTNPDGTAEGKDEGLADFFAELDYFQSAYTFNGIADDELGNNPSSTISGTIEYGDGRDGSGSIILDEPSDNVQIPFQPDPGDPWTISMWVYRENPSSFTQFLDFDESNGLWAFNQGSSMFIGTNSSDFASFFISGNEFNWVHLTFTHDGNNTIGFYSNGVFQGTQAINQISFETPLTLGESNNDGFANEISGEVDEVIIEPYVVNADWVWEVYKNYNPPPDFSVVAAGNERIQYSFGNVERADEYRIYRNGSLLTTQAASGSYIDENVQNGTAYTYSIEVVDTLGNLSQRSQEFTVVTYDGLIANFALDNGDPSDALGNYNANLSGTFLEDNRFGESEKALEFIFSNDSISTDLSFANEDTFSISTWVYWKNTNQTSFQHIFSFYEDNANKIYLGPKSDGEIRFGDPWEVQLGQSTGVFLDENRWVHIVATFLPGEAGTADRYQLYLDSELAVEQTISSTVDFGNLFIGSQGPIGEVFEGIIDEFLVFDKVLSQQEVLDIYGSNQWPGTSILRVSESPLTISAGSQDQILLILEAKSIVGETLDGLRINVSSIENYRNYQLYSSSELSSDNPGSLIGDFTIENENILAFDGLGLALTENPTYLYVVGDAEIDQSEGTTFNTNFTINEGDINIAQSPNSLFGFVTINSSVEAEGIADDLVAYYPFDGDALDYATSDVTDPDLTNNGVWTVNEAYTEDVTGNPNKAALFDGIESEVVVPSSEIFDTLSTELTLSTWVYINQFNEFGSPVFTKGGDTEQFGIYLGTGGIFFTSDAENAFTLADSVLLRTWTLITVTLKDNEMKFYLDGQLIDTKAVTPFSTNTDDLYIGSNPAGGYDYMDGALDELRIYSRALTPEQVSYLYNSTRDDLIVHLPFDGNTEDVIGENDGIVEGSSTFANDRLNQSSSAFSFDGQTKVTVPNVGPFVTTSFWMKSNTVPDTDNHILYVKPHQNGAIYIAIDLNGNIRADLLSSDGSIVYGSGNLKYVTDNKWHFVVATLGPDFFRMYLDGEEIDNIPMTSGDADLFRANTGVNILADASYTGLIDEFKLSDAVYYKEDVVEESTEALSGFFYNEDNDVSIWSLGSQFQEIGVYMDTDGSNLYFAGVSQNFGELKDGNNAFGGFDGKWLKIDPIAEEITSVFTIGNSNTDYLVDITYDQGSDDIIYSGYSVGVEGLGEGTNNVLIGSASAEGSANFSTAIKSNDFDDSRAQTILNDGDYVFVSDVRSTQSDDTVAIYGNYDAVVRRASPTGDIIWSGVYGGSGYESIRDAITLQNGNIAIVGFTESTDNDINENKGAADGWLLILDPNGTVLNSKTYGGSGQDEFYGIVQDDNGELIITGATNSLDGDLPDFTNGGLDAWILRVNSQDLSQIIWSRKHGGSGIDVFRRPLISHGQIVAVGYSSSGDGNFENEGDNNDDAIFVKLDKNGSIIYAKKYGANGLDRIYNVVETNDGRYYTGGVTYDGGKDVIGYKGGSSDMLVVRNPSDKTSFTFDNLAEQTSNQEIDITEEGYAKREVISGDFPTSFTPEFLVGTYQTARKHNLQQVLLDFEDNLLTQGYTSGSYTPGINNPQSENLNSSPFVGAYTRNSNVYYDVLEFVIDEPLFSSSEDLFNEEIQLRIDILTDAPVGTSVQINFENEEIQAANPFPAGQFARFTAYTTKQNEWQTLHFRLKDTPDTNFAPEDVNRLVIFFDIESFTDYSFSFDNLIIVDKGEEILGGQPTELEAVNYLSVTSESGFYRKAFKLDIIRLLREGNDITSINIPGGFVNDPEIDTDQGNITASVAQSVDLSTVALEYVISDGATIDPDPQAAGETVDFSDGFEDFTVTSESGQAKQWRINLTQELSFRNDIISFTLDDQTEPAVIDTNNHTVNITVDPFTDVTLLTPQIEISAGAGISPASDSTLNFINPVTYTVTAENGDQQEWTVFVTRQLNDEAELLSFNFEGIIDDVQIDSASGVVNVLASQNVDFTNVTIELEVSAFATSDPVSGSTVDLTPFVDNPDNPFLINVTAEDGIARVYSVFIETSISTKAEIIDFSVEGEIPGTLVINNTLSTVTLNVTTGVNITDVSPTIELSFGATLISPASIESLDFTNSITFQIQAENGSIRSWTVTLIPILNTQADILAINFPELTGNPVINTTSKTILARALFGTNLSGLSPEFEISVGAGIVPESGSTQDFTQPVVYTVTSEDGSNVTDWTITINLAPNTETDITAFTFDGIVETADINTTEHTVFALADRDSNFPFFEPDIEVSQQALIVPGSGILDFTDPVEYTVTAGDGVTSQVWTVTIEENLNSEADITSFTVGNKTGVPYPDRQLVEIILETGSDITSVTPTIIPSQGATISPDSGVPQDFSDTVVYRVTSEDQSVIKDWKAVAIVPGVNGIAPGFGAVQAPVSYAKGGGGFDVSVEFDVDFTSSVTVHYRKLGSNSTISADATIDGNEASFTFSDDDLNNVGVAFYFEGRYSFANETQTARSDTAFTVTENPDSVDISTDLSFGTEVSDYQILAFPFQNPDPKSIFKEFGEYNKSRWRLFRWRNDNYQEYNSNFNDLSPGVGYFFIAAQSAKMNVSGQSIPIQNGVFTINLQSGWNMIGNPFRGDIGWDEVINHNLQQGIISEGDIVNNELIKFEGEGETGFVLAGDMNEFEGGFINTTRDINGFEFPVSAILNPSERRSGQLPQPEQVDIDQDNWRFHLFVESPELKYLLGEIGFKEIATDYIDMYDLSHVPSLEKYIRIDFEGVAMNYKKPDSFKKWDFSIPNNIKSNELKIYWDHLQSNSNTLILVDNLTGKITNLQEAQSMRLENNPNKTYSLYYGDKDEIYQNIDIGRLSLVNLYPNPVEDFISLEVISPDQQYVYISIISLDGKTQLVRYEPVNSGFNRVQVDVRNLELANGAYIIKLEGFENQLIISRFIVNK